MGWECGRKPGFWIPGLRAGHPLVRGLVLAAPLAEPSPGGRWRVFDTAGRRQATRGNRRRQAGRIGMGAAHPGGANTAIEWTSRSGFTSTALTAAVLVEYGSARSTDSRLMTRGDAEPWDIRETFSGGQWQMAGRVRLADGTVRQVQVTIGDMPRRRLLLAVLRVRQATRWVRLDVFSSATGWSWSETTWPTGQILQASIANMALGDLPGTGQGGTSGWSGLIHGGWFWGRPLSDAEVGVLSRDPFGMFRRPRVQRLTLLTGPGGPPAPPLAWQRRRLEGSRELLAGAARMRPAGSESVYVGT